MNGVVLYGASPGWPSPDAAPPLDTFTISPRITDVVEQRLHEARLGVIETIEWVLRGLKLGEFTDAEAIKRIEKALGAVK